MKPWGTRRACVALGMLGLAATMAGGAAAPAGSVLAGTKPLALIATPAYVVRVCQRSRLIRAACPLRVPFAEAAQPNYVTFLCRANSDGCRGVAWDELDLLHADFGKPQPPAFVHLLIYAGNLGHALPPDGKTARLRDGLFAHVRIGPLLFGQAHWGARRGRLFLMPAYGPGTGPQGDHLVFEWRSGPNQYAIGLHAWEPLTQTAATLRQIVASVP